MQPLLPTRSLVSHGKKASCTQCLCMGYLSQPPLGIRHSATTFGSQGYSMGGMPIGDANAQVVQCAGVDSDRLCMDASLISDILQCRITSWSHRNISALNPGIR